MQSTFEQVDDFSTLKCGSSWDPQLVPVHLLQGKAVIADPVSTITVYYWGGVPTYKSTL